MAVIKSGDSTDQLSVDPTSKAARVTLYNSDGIEGTKEIPVLIPSAPVSIVDNDVISSLDVTEYKSVSIQLTGTWVGTVTFQGSNDNGSFYDIVAQDTTSLTSPFSAETTTVGLYNIPIVYKYLRVRLTAYTSGTVTCTAYGHKEDKSLNSVGQVGIVTLAEETTKVIGTVNVSADSNSVSGSITAADTSIAAPANDGVLLSGTPSVGSYVGIASSSNESAWMVEITGTLGGTTFYFEASASSTNGIDGNWSSISESQKGKSGNTSSYFSTTAGAFTGNVSGFSYFRVRAVGGVGIAANVVIRLAAGTSSVHLSESLPAGTNVVGNIDNVSKLGGVAVSMGGGVSDAGTQRVSLASDEPVALAAGATIIGSLDNVEKLGGVAVSMGAGVSDAGTQRVTLASDEPVNVGQLAGATVSMGAGVADAGTQRVVLPDSAPLQTDFYVTGVGAVDVNSRMIRTGACILKAAVFTSYAATPRHIKLYDTASAPTAGVGLPVLVLTRASSGNNSYPLPEGGFPFVNGIGMTFVQGAANNNAIGTATVDGSFTTIFT